MKKKKVDLQKKLVLVRDTIANLNDDEQWQLRGGAETNTPRCPITTTRTTITQEVSCRPTRIFPTGPCCIE
ncbi:class I lanthipeptide [Chitinophaga solisilvae]|uniref:Uncharacterized protein n=1 Tax=Chitinophaga solisilvae TaxID=1233460 RepID=A0A3S1D063_9BACT|nr:class I lanthipeptide [Chitinophaga solisilvae]NSL90929.1 hypothetical protein [Chitinophaga solisilvae]